MSKELADVAYRKYELSGQQFSFAATKYRVGKIAAIEFSYANKEYLEAKQSYLSVLKSLFVNYYKIRHLALYDFIESKDMIEIIKNASFNK